MKTVRILVIDSHQGFWHDARLRLHVEAGVEVIEAAPLAPTALARVDESHPDVVAIDIAFPSPAAVELISQVSWRSPGLPVVALCDKVDDARISLAIAAGARACVARSDGAQTIARAVVDVAGGGFPLQQDLVGRPSLLGELVVELQRRLREACFQSQSSGPATRCPLTERELVILEMVAGGQANKEIADTLAIAERTVKNHVANILDKLAARGRAHAVALAIENRWICQREARRPVLMESVA